MLGDKSHAAKNPSPEMCIIVMEANPITLEK